MTSCVLGELDARGVRSSPRTSSFQQNLFVFNACTDLSWTSVEMVRSHSLVRRSNRGENASIIDSFQQIDDLRNGAGVNKLVPSAGCTVSKVLS